MSISLQQLGEYRIPVSRRVDVLVAGGGPSGIGAAVASARLGAATLLIEQYGFLGGMATAGLVSKIGGFYSATPDPVRVVGGVAEEITEALAAAGSLYDPVLAFGKIRTIPYDPEIFKLVADQFVSEAGVDVLLHTRVSDVLTACEGECVKGLIVESKSGREVILAEVVIDATGDADVAARAGAGFDKSDRPQAATTIFVLGNVHIPSTTNTTLETLAHLANTGLAQDPVFANFANGVLYSIPERNQVVVNMSCVNGIDGTNVIDLTKGELEGRKQIKRLLEFFREKVPGFENAYLDKVATQIGVRESRRIKGRYVLTEEDVRTARSFDDVIAHNPWPIELHKGAQEKLQWIGGSGYCDIPMRCLIPRRIQQLLVAGRCISTTHLAQASCRIMAVAIATGQAAGVIAASAVQQGLSPCDVKPVDVQRALYGQGGILLPRRNVVR